VPPGEAAELLGVTANRLDKEVSRLSKRIRSRLISTGCPTEHVYEAA
jgi:hypothetical protein